MHSYIFYANGYEICNIFFFLLICILMAKVSELGFNVPPTTRPYGDGTSVKSLIQKTVEAGKKRGIDLANPGLLV